MSGIVDKSQSRSVLISKNIEANTRVPPSIPNDKNNIAACAPSIQKKMPSFRNIPRYYFRFRRLIDILVSVTTLTILLPIFTILAALVMIDVGRAVIFVQVRPGRYMRPFKLYKFRTMRDTYDSSQLCDYERTSPFGRLLRRTRLDELPQLYNVLIGDMSLIGPRPLLPRDLPKGAAVNQRAALRPGITGWAQVHGGCQLNIAEKMTLDHWYACHASPVIDAKIVILTVKMMIWGEMDIRSYQATAFSHDSTEIMS